MRMDRLQQQDPANKICSTLGHMALLEEVDSDLEVPGINVVRWVEDSAHMEAEIDGSTNTKTGNAHSAEKETIFRRTALPAKTWGPRMSP
jgi:hypothetical protein